MLEAHIVKRRRELVVDVKLELEPGASLALFGASGSGKSTVLSCIAGIVDPDSGFVRFDGRQFFPPPMPLHERRVGYLTQDPYLFPHLTVEGNIAFAAKNDSKWTAQMRDRLNLGSIWQAPASKISGGQARRVALARMLAQRPPLVLLDEPFTGLDRQLVRELIAALLMWRAELGFCLIVVDHESEILERLCSRVAVIANGQMIQKGTWVDVRQAPVNSALHDLLKPL